MATELQIREPNAKPFLGWRYTQPQTAEILVAGSLPDLIKLVVRYRKSMHLSGVPLEPSIVEQEVVKQICESNPPDTCEGSTSSIAGRKLGLAELAEGTMVLGSWVAEGRPPVSPEEANRRAAICVGCPLNRVVGGCLGCIKFADIVATANGSRSTEFDEKLENCLVCGCSNKAQVWLPLEFLHTDKHKERNHQFPDHCWKKITTP